MQFQDILTRDVYHSHMGSRVHMWGDSMVERVCAVGDEFGLWDRIQRGILVRGLYPIAPE